MPRVSDKRERLIAAGQRLFHRRGVADTSLADVAEESGVPMGNIYYYFKTKDELVEAVAEHQRHGIHRLFEELDRNPQPEQRLSKFLASFESVREERAAYGCPVGVLCQEMTRGSDPSTAEARAGFEQIVSWLERQFAALGFSKKRSRDHATHILAAIQGASVVAHAFHDANVVRSETREMRRWLAVELASRSTRARGAEKDA
ncbi:MAG: TetR/AcrR family transcriptional regulator [Xanthobacteraceae bacterium]